MKLVTMWTNTKCALTRHKSDLHWKWLFVSSNYMY